MIEHGRKLSKRNEKKHERKNKLFRKNNIELLEEGRKLQINFKK